MRLAAAVGEPLGDRPFTLPPGASLHYQGTMRMAETDDGRGVCGPDSELWAVPGVYVAGNGVIPTPTRATRRSRRWRSRCKVRAQWLVASTAELLMQK